MLSIQGGDAGRSQAIRITWVSMPPGWESWEGQSLFVQQPWWGSENGGTSFYVDQGPGAPNTLLLAGLACEPYYTDWTQYGVIHVIHPAIVPSKLVQPAGPVEVAALYDIQFVAENCNLQLESNFSAPLQLRTAAWGDVVALANGLYRVPDDSITIVDTVAMIAKFSGDPAAPSKAGLSLLGVTNSPGPSLDGVITINELVAVIGAFSGEDYPFFPSDTAPPPGICPPP